MAEFKAKRAADPNYGRDKRETVLILLDYYFGPIQCDWTDEEGRQITRIPVIDSDEETKYGTKYKFDTTIKGKDGAYRPANVTVVVQNDHGKTTWRLITVTPGKKDK